MTDISAAMVKQLRDATGAGMMACKGALQETEGDFDKAVVLLREKGMASAAKRADRETTEGVVLIGENGSTAAMVAVGCETEPVSKNDDFRAFAAGALEAVEQGGEEAAGGLDEQRVELTARLGENIQIVGAKRLSATDGELIETYVHKESIGVLVVGKGSPKAAHDLALHISFARPTYRSRSEVPAELVEAERDILLKQEDIQAQPEERRAMIVDGRLNKFFFGEAVLEDQPWIHDDKLTVAKALGQGGFELTDYAWLSVR